MVWISVIGVIMLLNSCATMQSITSVEPEAKVDTSFEKEMGPYSGPKASLAVAKFDWKVDTSKRKATLKIGGTEIAYSEEEVGVMDGLRDMLTTTLVQSKRYKVLERQELSEVKSEIDLSQSEYVDQTKKVEKGKIKGADILVVAAVTGWEPGAEKTGGGLGAIIPGAGASILGAVEGAFKKSYMAMDIRIIDSATTEVLAATRVEGTAKEVDLGALAGGIFGTVPLGGALGKYKKTPMEKAIRLCIKEAVKYIIDNTPKEYFKY